MSGTETFGSRSVMDVAEFRPSESRPSAEGSGDHGEVNTRTEVVKSDTSETEDIDASGSGAVKHPLHQSWVMWLDAPAPKSQRGNAANWISQLNQLSTFDAAETFWGTLEAVPPPSRLGVGATYFLFKQGIRPVWEDAANESGGRFVATLPRNGSVNPNMLWRDLCCALVGEQLSPGRIVCGAAFSSRQRGDKIAIWLAFTPEPEETLSVGRAFKQIIRMPSEEPLVYQPHPTDMAPIGPPLAV